MPSPFNPLLSATQPPAIVEAWRWTKGVSHPPERPLMVFSQAAPALPPPLELRQALAEALISKPELHLYGADLGMPALREALAARTAQLYGGKIHPDQVAITAGANQAFTAVMTSLAGSGDEILLPVPWYFNHAMHCQMSGLRAVPLPTDSALLPDLAQAEALIGPRTKAIVLVTPNNPAGVEYPPPLIAGFRDLCRTKGLALVIDETYRDFHASDAAPHTLFTDPDWDDTVVQLYSFSKAYRLTGHRVGAVLTSAKRLAEIEKYIDTTTICPNQLGQFAALWGLNNLDNWLAGERQDILARRAAMASGFATLPGWHLIGLGAYFAYVRHPYAMTSTALCQKLVSEASILLLPGSMFRPENDVLGQSELRIAFANADLAGIAELFKRLATVDLPLARRPEGL
jgi:aspartate/methionine/tyrosine aminotransferase